MLRIALLFLGSLTFLQAGNNGIILRDDIVRSGDKKKLELYDQQCKLYWERDKAMNPAVLQGAEEAVILLGQHVLKGNYNYGVTNMYPRYRKKLVGMAGSEQAMLLRFKKSVAESKSRGVVIESFNSGTPKRVYNVWMKRDKTKAFVYYPLDYTSQKLTIVPTSKVVKVKNQRGGKDIRFEKKSYQVVIYDPITKKYSFIGGDDLDINSLRSVFPTLPLVIKFEMRKSGKVL